MIMKKSEFPRLRTLLGAMALFSMPASAANATIIGFEDFSFNPADPYAVNFPVDGYQGLDWGGQYGAYSWAVSPDTSIWFGGPEAFAGNNFAWSNGGSALALSRHGGGTFAVESFYAKTFVDFGTFGTVHGYLNGIEVATQSYALSGSYALISLNFSGIDALRVDQTSPLAANTIIDNLSVSFGGVPEPASWTLMLSGFGLAGAALRRRQSVRVTYA
jgi:hypothetical protein